MKRGEFQAAALKCCTLTWWEGLCALMTLDAKGSFIGEREDARAGNKTVP